MILMATYFPTTPWLTWLYAWWSPLDSYVSTPGVTAALVAVTTGAPHGGEHPANEAATENYYAYLPLFVP